MALRFPFHRVRIGMEAKRWQIGARMVTIWPPLVAVTLGVIVVNVHDKGVGTGESGIVLKRMNTASASASKAGSWFWRLLVANVVTAAKMIRLSWPRIMLNRSLLGVLIQQ